MHPSSTPLTELRINTYEDPFLQHQYVCLGHKIAIIRVSLNMSQQELARHIGISRSYLSKLVVQASLACLWKFFLKSPKPFKST